MLSSLFALIAHRKCLGVVSVLLLIVLPAVAAQAGPFQFTKVTSGFGIAGSPALDAGQIAFVGQGPGDPLPGIYTGPIGGPYGRVVDDSSVVSGTLAPLGDFSFEFGFDAGRVAIYGGQGESRGIYLYSDGRIQRIADRTTAIPGAAKTFNVLHGPPSIDNGVIAFDGQSGTTVGVKPLRGAYLARDGELSRVADTTMPTPGDTRNFSDSFSSSTIDGDKVAFIGNRFDRPGIYLHDLKTGVQSLVVDTSTRLPGRTETFGTFDGLAGGLDLDGDTVAFIGRDYPMSGVYVADTVSGTLTTIAEDLTTIYAPEFAQFGGAFRSVAIDDGQVAFAYSYSGGGITQDVGTLAEPEFHGVYRNLSGSLTRVLATGDMLDGNLVSRVHMGRQGLDGDQILIEVSFADKTEALYVATLIPEPGTLALLATGCLTLAMARWRRRFHVPSIAVFAFTLFLSVTTQCTAADIVWGYEGVVDTTSNLPLDIEVGSQYGGIISFTSEPDATTVYDTIAESQHHLWSGAGTGIELSLGGADFSTIGRPNNRLTMHYRDEGIDIPLHLREDSVFIGASAESYWYSSPPGGPGSTGVSYGGFRRNIHIELHDFDGAILAGALPLEVPFDIREMEEATFGASTYPADGPGSSFTGTIDRLYAIPEPATVLLLGVGIGLLGIGCTMRHATLRAERT